METEIEAAKKGNDRYLTFYLDQGLHRTPGQMAGRIQKIVDQVDGTVEMVVLGYGLCSNGIVGVRSGTQTMIVPRCHDCIGFFL
jgi:hypothetical protein